MNLEDPTLIVLHTPLYHNLKYGSSFLNRDKIEYKSMLVMPSSLIWSR